MTHPLNLLNGILASPRTRAGGLTFSAWLLCQCGAPIAVSTITPVPPPAVKASPSASCLLANIREDTRRIASGDTTAIAAYNYSVARLLERLGSSGAKVWDGPVDFSDSWGSFNLTGKAPAGITPGACVFHPTDTLRFSCNDIAEARRVLLLHLKNKP